MACLTLIFDDKRLTCLLLVTWLTIVLVIFTHLGVGETAFMSFGPSPKTFFMGVKLDTWYKWSLVAMFTFVSTAINDFVGDAVVPWIQNTVQDHKSRYIPYSKVVCWLITQCWSVYCSTMSIFSIYLLMSQVDFLMIRAAADLIVNTYTTFRFLRGKQMNAEKYAQWYNSHGDDDAAAAADVESRPRREDGVATSDVAALLPVAVAVAAATDCGDAGS